MESQDFDNYNNEIMILFYQNEAEKNDKAVKSIIQIHFPIFVPES